MIIDVDLLNAMQVLIEPIRKPLFDDNFADNKEMCLRDAAMKMTVVGGHVRSFCFFVIKGCSACN